MPSQLALDVISSSQIDLTWRDEATTEAGFRVERFSAGAYVTVATLPADTARFSEFGLSGGVTYRYRVLAFNGAGDSAPSLDAAGMTPLSPAAQPTSSSRLAGVNDWVYAIQDPDLQKIAATKYDLAVVDYSGDGSQAAAFSRADVAQLKSSGSGKTVLAYLSIGEAEDYRFYWQLAGGVPGADWTANPPTWLERENPNFPGDYKVRFWEPEWQRLVIHNPGNHPVLGNTRSYLDRILDAGFDGVFLDIVDGFEYWGPVSDGGNGKRQTAAQDMVKFLASLATYARGVDPAFVVCQQNGSFLLSPNPQTPLTAAERVTLLSTVDMLSVEDVFYQGSADANNPLAPDAERIGLIDAYRQANKLVTIIDCFDSTQPGFDRASLDDFYSRAKGMGWTPYRAWTISVDALQRTTGSEPSGRQPGARAGLNPPSLTQREENREA